MSPQLSQDSSGQELTGSSQSAGLDSLSLDDVSIRVFQVGPIFGSAKLHQVTNYIESSRVNSAKHA